MEVWFEGCGKLHIMLQEALADLIEEALGLLLLQLGIKAGDKLDVADSTLFKKELTEAQQILYLMPHSDIGVFDNGLPGTNGIWYIARSSNLK